jgi:hypothetical protein
MAASKEEKLIEDIRSGKFSESELVNLYRNASTRGASAVMESVKIKMRADFPRAANRMFGAKESEATALLEKVYRDLASSLDLTRNRLKNGIKAGGHLLSGEKHIDVYISFRNHVGVGAALALVQDDPESELVARVGYYEAGTDAVREVKDFQMHDFNDAVAAYRAELSKAINST